MSLFDGLPIDDAPVAPSRVAAPETPYLVTIKRASNGDEILLCNVVPPPAGAITEARTRKLPLFTLNEIEPMRRIAAADPSALAGIISARRIMGWGGPITFQGAK